MKCGICKTTNAHFKEPPRCRKCYRIEKDMAALKRHNLWRTTKVLKMLIESHRLAIDALKAPPMELSPVERSELILKAEAALEVAKREIGY